MLFKSSFTKKTRWTYSTLWKIFLQNQLVSLTLRVNENKKESNARNAIVQSILATGLSASIIEQAFEGKYSRELMNKYTQSFQQYLPNGNINDFFIVDGRYVKVNNQLKNIEFRIHNLLQDSMYRKFNIIFYRNVMIYFDDTLKMTVLRLFHDSLEKDGYFIIGYYNMLPPENKELFAVDVL